MKIILIFKVCPCMFLFRGFHLIFMFPIFCIYIDLKLYLHIFVLRKCVTKKRTLQMSDVFCCMLQRGVNNITPPNARGSGK